LPAQQRYDLLIKNGRIIDPHNGIDAVRDVGIKDHKIAAVDRHIPATHSLKVINARGMLVTPGLVDIHTHVYAGTGVRGGYGGDNSVYPDGFTFRSCVTTVADAGSSGWKNFPDFKDRIIDRSKTRIFAFVNIVGSGMGGRIVEQNTQDMEPEATAALIKQYPDIIVGIKTAHYEAPDWTAVDRALAAGELAHVPVMVDFGIFRPERPYEDLVTKNFGLAIFLPICISTSFLCWMATARFSPICLRPKNAVSSLTWVMALGVSSSVRHVPQCGRALFLIRFPRICTSAV
jgi:dihydroorotase